MKLLLAIFAIGLGVFSYSFTLEPFHDVQEFHREYATLASGSRDTEAFWQLREESLTPKWRLQDLGITLLLLCALLAALARYGWRAPSKRAVLVQLGLALPFVTSGGFVFDLVQGMHRHEFPSWADSLGIPLAGVPVQIVVLLAWSGLHLAFLGRGFQSGAHLQQAIAKSNAWLLLIASITALLAVLFAAEGAYMYAVPGVLWLYYYLSLAASTGGRDGTPPNATADV